MIPVEFKLFIDGAFCEAADGARFESIDPAHETVWTTVPEAGEEDVDRAVAAARNALTAGPWAAMTATQRGHLLRRLGDLLVERSSEFAEIETRDTGKIIRETAGQAAYMASYYHYFGGMADKIEGAVLPIDKPDMITMTVREPLGVVAAVIPWNGQILLTASKLAPALAAGNTVVLKASEDGPATLLKFAELIDAAGFPPGVVNIITGFGERCGKRLTSHPDVARVAFTGGTETARHIVRNTAENLATLSLELGGKSPLIVFDDADLDSATNGIVAGVFGAAGQSCVSSSRLLVHENVHDELLARLIRIAESIRIGDPLDHATEMGPLCTARQRHRIEGLVADTIASGGTLLTGGGRPSDQPQGFYWQPTIIDCPHDGLPTIQEELFGPVLSVRQFSDEGEAIEIANSSRYALAGGAFTRDIGRAMRVGQALSSGIAYINTWRVVSPIAPFGGNQHSGFGREGGSDAIRDYTRVKTIWINTSDAPMADPFVMR